MSTVPDLLGYTANGGSNRRSRRSRCSRGGNGYQCEKCVLIQSEPSTQPQSTPPQSTPPQSTPSQSSSVSSTPPQLPHVSSSVKNENVVTGGGRGMTKSAYKKYLEKMSVEKLQKMATKKGLKITKKKDGKTVYVKKTTIVKKLVESKY